MPDARSNCSQLKIGVIIPSLHEHVQQNIFQGIVDFATRKRIHLVNFIATSQNQLKSLEPHYQLIRNFVKRGHLDGILLFSGAMAEHLESHELDDLVRDMSSKPVVGIASTLDGVTSILVDNTAGLHQLVEHLVEIHHKRQFVYVRGPEGHEEAEERYTAVLAALEKKGIPTNLLQVYPGNFSADSGQKAVRHLLENKVEFDAIIAADDDTAMGAIEELRASGWSVPTDCAVVGFDDISNAATVIPSLTTICQPLYMQGKTAIATLHEMIKGNQVGKSITLSTETVIRRSCGCFSKTVTEAGKRKISGDDFTRKGIESSILGSLQHYHTKTSAKGIPFDSTRWRHIIVRLVDSFISNGNGDDFEDKFLGTVDRIMFEAESIPNKTAMVMIILDSLIEVIPRSIRDEDVATAVRGYMQQASALVVEQSIRLVHRENTEKAQLQLEIRETSQQLITSFELNRLLHVVGEEFPKLNIETFYVAMFENRESESPVRGRKFSEESRLLLAHHQGENKQYTEGKQLLFPTGALYPQNIFPQTGHDNLLVMPLFFKEENFGFIVFQRNEKAPEFMYEELRLHLSSAIKSAFWVSAYKSRSVEDELTGLFNRRGFITVGKELVDSGKAAGSSIWLLYIDLNGLKYINETYGHDEGDCAIQATAQILQNTFRTQDVLGRIGGDEFTVIMIPNRESDPAEMIGARLQNNIDKYNKTSGKPYELSMCIGYSPFGGRTSDDFETLMKEADDMLCKLKEKRSRKRGEAP